MRDVIIIGGGVSGLVNASILSSSGIDVLLIEKKSYPFHRVCGEYVSNEAVPFLRTLGLYPEELNPPKIGRLLLSSASGAIIQEKLESGGFGITRYSLDFFLYQKAKERGAEIREGVSVLDVSYNDDHFTAQLSDGTVKKAKIVIGCYGKRANLDRTLSRDFFQKQSPYMGVKYHIKLPNYPKDLISLHNFSKGYCGISAVEDDKLCFCYLTDKENMKGLRSIKDMEKEVLSQNPFLRKVFADAEFLHKRPYTINAISFSDKKVIENHVLMCGDTAGMITPLCGNGMAMAIHSAKILSELVVKFFNNEIDRSVLEEAYELAWTKLFSSRVKAGRLLQKLMSQPMLSNISVALLKNLPYLPSFVIKQTHGKPF
ncbi:NAD(P)/FAD-dependent oxidoreductase [Cytophagaceae bacterium ABcell3]|nr:NAD(P)/FAD-dependent oxidoreductase [Cytophagaceae bacterium ABcell3]